MAKTIKQDAAVKKLTATIKKLKNKLSKSTQALAKAEKKIKTQTIAFQQQLHAKLKALEASATLKAKQELDRIQQGRDKVIANAIQKFEKAWIKKSQTQGKKRKSKKRATVKSSHAQSHVE